MAGRFHPPERRPAIPFLAPYQLAAAGEESWTTTHFQGIYQLFIGDNTQDFADFWSSIFWSRNWLRTHQSQLWIPTSLIKDHAVHEALLDWLRRFTGSGSHDRQAVPLSRSLSAQELESIRESLYAANRPIFTNAPYPGSFEQRLEKAAEELTGRPSRPGDSRSDPVRFTARDSDERFSIPKPDLLSDEINQSGSWMVDLQIEHLSEFRSTSQEQSWWLLPRQNSAGLLWGMFRAPARISRGRRFSVSVGHQTYSQSALVKPEITLSLPEGPAVIRLFLEQPHALPFFTVDSRNSLPRQPALFSSCKLSEKGANLAGLIGLFGNFWTAKSFCERRFWRRLFSKLAGHSSGNDEKLQGNVSSLLQKGGFSKSS